ncbi:restriction endonuclease [Streptomyces sp. NPDC006656]|uniref:restriction endonuclease n=1 Tax=Streptomyces sp. NPDC006656 TaxID=3156899 RepID=UPI003453E91E
MIVNDAEKIRPKRYAHKIARNWIGDSLGKVKADEFLAAWIWCEEASYAMNIYFHIAAQRDELEREAKEAKARREAAMADTPTAIAVACRKAAGTLADALATELREAKEAAEEARAAWKSMQRLFGSRPEAVYEAEKETPGPSTFETVIPLWNQHLASEKRVKKLISTDRAELHRIALLDAHRMAFIRSEASVSLDDIRDLHHTDFEQLAADLVRRDGFTVTQSKGGSGDLGADVIAVGPDGKILVIQCKHSKSGTTTIGSPDLQRLNGTARPVHKADVVVAMTNGSFSMPARRFAESQNIHLIESRELEQWATWGQPLRELLAT